MDRGVRDQSFGPVITHNGEPYYIQDHAFCDYCPLEASYQDTDTQSAYFAYAVNDCGDKYIRLRWDIINPEAEEECDTCDWDEYEVIDSHEI